MRKAMTEVFKIARFSVSFGRQKEVIALKSFDRKEIHKIVKHSGKPNNFMFECRSFKQCMVLSFVYVILMNGSLKLDTKATEGAGLDLTFCTKVLGEVKGEGLQTRNGSCR